MFSSYKPYKDRYPFETRKIQAQEIRTRYPDRIPVIVEPYQKSLFKTAIPLVSKQKLLVPQDLSFGQLVYTIRNKIRLSPDLGIYLFVNNELIPPSCLMSEVY